MSLWEDSYRKYKESNIDFGIDKIESMDEVSGEEFGNAFLEDVNKVFEDDVDDEKLSDLLYAASTYPIQPFSDKLKSFRAWLGNFIRMSNETSGYSGDAIALYNKEFEREMEEARETTEQ